MFQYLLGTLFRLSKRSTRRTTDRWGRPFWTGCQAVASWHYCVTSASCLVFEIQQAFSSQAAPRPKILLSPSRKMPRQPFVHVCGCRYLQSIPRVHVGAVTRRQAGQTTLCVYGLISAAGHAPKSATDRRSDVILRKMQWREKHNTVRLHTHYIFVTSQATRSRQGLVADYWTLFPFSAISTADYTQAQVTSHVRCHCHERDVFYCADRVSDERPTVDWSGSSLHLQDGDMKSDGVVHSSQQSPTQPQCTVPPNMHSRTITHCPGQQKSACYGKGVTDIQSSVKDEGKQSFDSA
jgi:hypothetical protein